jgi:hypothetical protein
LNETRIAATAHGAVPAASSQSPSSSDGKSDPRDVVIWRHVAAATRLGTGAGATRNIAGTNHPLVERS